MASSAQDVFINCPFDDDYQPMFDAMLFAISACGFRPRCALEVVDGSEVRINKLFRMIGECRFSIHDLSRVQLSEPAKLPRFNMPLELGIWLGAKHYGSRQKNKVCLIVDAELHRFQKFVSDISGQDPVAHNDSPDQLVAVIRNWLQTVQPDLPLPGGSVFANFFQRFMLERIELTKNTLLVVEELTFLDRVRLIRVWLEVNTLEPGT